MVLVLAGCAGGSGDSSMPGDSSDPAAHDTSGDTAVDTADPCYGAPALTWDNFGEGFLLAHCQGCHATASPDRHDAPEEVTFDTVEQAWYWAPDILARSTGKDPTMPPLGGTEEVDRQRLWWWLTCGVAGT